MAESSQYPQNRDVISLQKNAFIAVMAVAASLALSALVLSTIAWKKLHAPMTTNVTNNEYKNQSQWQATVVFPNGGVPVEIEHFVYIYSGSKSLGLQDTAKVKMDYLSGRCLWWLESGVPYYRTEASIITCFKEKQKK
jgi:hypothetical protein